MPPVIEVDDDTYRALALAAKFGSTTIAAVVSELLVRSVEPAESTSVDLPGNLVHIVAKYDGRRTTATFDVETGRVDVLDGALAGKRFKSPSGAAQAVVRQSNADVSSNRNGWVFWIVDDGSGRPLQAIRRDQRRPIGRPSPEQEAP
jgi:hypothetical protein